MEELPKLTFTSATFKYLQKNSKYELKREDFIIIKSCIDCKFFSSYQAMYEDPENPHDSGVCQGHTPKRHVAEWDAIDCNEFELNAEANNE